MKSTILVLLFLASFAFAQSPSPAAIQRVDVLFSETIPLLSLKDATFDQALDSIRQVWNERHPDEPFPVGLTAFLPPEGYRKEYGARITLELKNVPYMEALLYIADLSGRRFSIRRGLPQVEHITWIEEDWVARIHHVTPEVLAGLQLHSDATPEDIRRALAAFGIKLEEWMKPRLMPGGTRLVLTSYVSQQEQLAGIITLLRNGFKISK